MAPHASLIFSPYLKDLTVDSGLASALQGHPDVQLLIDVLARYQRHHVLLKQKGGPLTQYHHLLIALAQQLHTERAPAPLKGASLYYVDLGLLACRPLERSEIQQGFAELTETARALNGRTIFAVSSLSTLLNETLQPFAMELKALLHHDQWRFLILDQGGASASRPCDWDELFQVVEAEVPTDAAMLSLLKSTRTALENFHQVTLAEETFPFALSMTGHYLSGTTAYRLDKAHELLDTAAARASMVRTAGTDPIVTNTHLIQVVSNWTHIPLANLQTNKFQATQFIEALRQPIFGQDSALQMIGPLLQNACLKLKKKQGPLCRLLLAGPAGTGKSTFAAAMAEYLFGSAGALLRAYFTKSAGPLTDIRVRTGTQSDSLLSAIQKAPYAIILIEDIEKWPAETFPLLQDILQYGHAFDADHLQYDFQNAIFIFTTTLGSDRLLDLMQNAPDKNKPVDLMQLVLNNRLHDFSLPQPHHLTAEEVRDEMMGALKNHFSADFLAQLDIVPFMPLEYDALEKAVVLALKSLAKNLENHFRLELQYSAEVIKFLAQGAYLQRSCHSLNKLLEQQLFSCVGHEIIAYHENHKIKSKRLMVKLNDEGDLLRCEFVNTNVVETRLYQ